MSKSLHVFALRCREDHATWHAVRGAVDSTGSRPYWTGRIEVSSVLTALLFDEPKDVRWGGRPVRALDIETDADLSIGLSDQLRLRGCGTATVVPGRLLGAGDLDGLFVRWKEEGDEFRTESIEALLCPLRVLAEESKEALGLGGGFDSAAWARLAFVLFQARV